MSKARSGTVRCVIAVGTALLGAAVVSAVVSGCAGDTPTPGMAPRATITAASAAPSGQLPCGAQNARALVLRSADGTRLAALETGSGPRGVVLVPESGARGKCGWLPYATVLAAAGFHVLAFDDRCQGESACPQPSGDQSAAADPAVADGADVSAALAALRRDGVTREVLMGASAGASEALAFVARPYPGLRAVVALSPDQLDRDFAAAAAIRLPALLAVAPDDPYVKVADLRRLLARLGTPTSQRSLTVLPAGSGHGWELVADSAPASFRADLLTFVARSTA